MQSTKIEALHKPRVIDKEWLRRQIADHNERSGFELIPGATAEMAQHSIAESLRARGVDPETLRCPQDDID